MQAEMGGVIETLWAEADAGLLEAPAEGADLGEGAAGAGSDAGEAGAGSGEELDNGAGEGEAGGDGAAGDGGAGEAGGEELSGAKLWNASKEQLKTLDPKLRSAINKAIHQADRLGKAFPEGVEKVTATLNAVKQLGEDPAAPIEKVIADTLGERNYFRDLDQAYTDAKPEFVEKLADAKPEAFDALAPMVFAKYAQTNPDGFSGYVARTVVQHMDSSDVPLQFKVLATFLPQLPDGPAKDRVIEAIEGVYKWSQDLRGLAAKKPAAVTAPGKDGAKPGEELATREQQLAERERNVTLKDWNTEALQPGIQLVYAEADKYAAGKKLTAEERKKVLTKVGEELDVRLAGNKAYGETMRGYLQAGNKQAFLQRLGAERKKLIPGAARRAVDDVIAERPKAQPAVKRAAAAAGAGKDGARAAAAAGSGEKVEWIAGHPSTAGLVVDLNRTSHAMLLKKRAFIKGRETPVAWK